VRIQAAFPGDAILGEELGESAGDSGYRWILDPIDGTKSFIAGVPLYSTLVGIQRDGACVAGVIHLPALGEMLFAVQGGGAWLASPSGELTPARVSRCSKLADATFVTSQVGSFAARGASAVFERLEAASYVTRTWGDAYGYFLVATGRAEIMVDPVMNLWDAAAILPIVQEAGGSFTDWQGRPTVDSGEGLATNGELLDEVLAITRPFRPPVR
jgi:histidinol phosphatase-like enzyme (inositol monophosphatase family)